MGKGLFSNSRQKTIVAVVPNQMSSAYYFLLQIRPAVNHGIRELEDRDIQHVIIEVGLICYLMGMGFDYRTARAAVESWETDENLVEDGILVE